MALHAADAIGLLDHLGLKNVHLMGLVGMGACIAQWHRASRPGAQHGEHGGLGARTPALRPAGDVRDIRIPAFRLQTRLPDIALPDYYNANRDKLLRPQGPGQTQRALSAHRRLVAACLARRERPAPADPRANAQLHSGQDQVTGPRTTLPLEHGIPGAEGVLMNDVAHVVAGREQKAAFAKLLLSFLERH
jgi:hypothetical protein